MITKKQLRNLVPGSPEYVYAHAQWRKKRGKLHSTMSFSLIKNPARALLIAKNYLENYKKFPNKVTDPKIHDEILLSVERIKDGSCAISTRCGSLYVEETKDSGEIPKAGQLVRYYFMGRDAGIGATIRGLDFEGRHCRYETEQQVMDQRKKWIEDSENRDRQKFQEEKALLDKRYNQFPAVFKQRIDKFRNNNPDFRWKYEASESELCRQAVLLAKYLHTKTGARQKIGKIPEADKKSYSESIEEYAKQFEKLPVKMQVDLVKGYSDSHSGNSESHVLMLAYFYLTNPLKVIMFHGWLSIICGSEEFGDVPRKKVA